MNVILSCKTKRQGQWNICDKSFTVFLIVNRSIFSCSTLLHSWPVYCSRDTMIKIDFKMAIKKENNT